MALKNRNVIFRFRRVILASLLFCFCIAVSNACTIFSAQDENGNVWAGNNEDDFFTFETYLNVFPAMCSDEYGYLTFSYINPENGANANTEGGFNEAGLFFDFNALDMFGKTYRVPNRHLKQSFPAGDHEIFNHLMKHLKSVPEVIEFFDTYWFDVGFNTAQMHVADKYGNFAIINATGSKMVQGRNYQVSTNFSICDDEDGSECWRYPIADKIVRTREIGFSSFVEACSKTAQRSWATTIYSNIQNLTTGEFWLFYGLDYANPFYSSLDQLLKNGRRSYYMPQLFSEHALAQTREVFIKSGGEAALTYLNQLNLPEASRLDVIRCMAAAFTEKANLEIAPFLSEYLRSDPLGYIYPLTLALSTYRTGDIVGAKKILYDYRSNYPQTYLNVDRIVNRMSGQADENANAVFTLPGYSDATNVLVSGLADYSQEYILIKKGNSWEGEFYLPNGIYNYAFIVDGKEVLNPMTPTVAIHSAFGEATKYTHQLCIEFSQEKYQRTILVTVPASEDVVYIAGNQASLTNWNSIFRLEKINDFQRTYTIHGHFPMEFKFTKGNWETEAVLDASLTEQKPITIDANTSDFSYKILGWKNE